MTRATVKRERPGDALKLRVEEALEVAGVPRAADGQRGWLVETSNGTVRLFWGYGKPALKAERAQSALGQCYYLLNDAGFAMPEKMFKNREIYIEVLG